jgi:cytochrome P450
MKPEYIEKMDTLVDSLLVDALKQDVIEIVRDFAIPLQSRALSYLLNVEESEADLWITWGTHVFRDESGESKGAEMEAYTNSLFDRAEAAPGDDFFSALVKARYRGRPLTREEMQGYANIAFAGGRDTVINTVAIVMAYIADHPEALEALRDNPKLVITATEELFRYASPVTHLGRVCPVATDVHGVNVQAGKLISLNWASANFDETIFDQPETVQLDRKPNPHIAFGNGVHNCLGAAHARLIIRSLLRKLCQHTAGIELISAQRKVEKEVDYERANAFLELNVRLIPR